MASTTSQFLKSGKGKEKGSASVVPFKGKGDGKPAAPPVEDAPQDSPNIPDISAMTGPDIEKFLKDHTEIEKPTGWSKMTVAKKREWLSEALSHTDEPEAPAEDEGEGVAEDPPFEVDQPAADDPGPESPVEEAPAEGTDAIPAPAAEVLPAANPIEALQNVKSMSAADADRAIRRLVDSEGMSAFMLGGVLAHVVDNDLWKEAVDGEEFSSFRDYLIRVHDLKYARANYLIRAYRTLVHDADLSWAQIENVVAKMGWAKLRYVVDVITADTVDYWIEQAQTHNKEQLRGVIKAHKTAAKTGSDPDPEALADAKKIRQMVLKFHPDQYATVEAAIDKAREETNNPDAYQTVLFEHICMSYVSGPSKPVKKASPKDFASAEGLKAVMQEMRDAAPKSKAGLVKCVETIFNEAFDEVFPEATVKIDMSSAGIGNTVES